MNDAPTDFPKRLANIAAGQALTLSAGNASASLDRFAVWMLFAFGAGVALILSHIDEVQRYIPVASISRSTRMFIFATIVCVVERYIAVIVSGAAKSGIEGVAIGEKYQNMDIDAFLSEMKRGIPAIARRFVSRVLDSASKGDYAASGRLLNRLTVWQGFLVLVEAALLIWGLIQLLNGITGQGN